MTFALDLRTHLNADPDDSFARIQDVERYASLTPTVHEVIVSESTAREQLSDWRVAFRGGVLCWTERDHIDRRARTMEFVQVEGDVDRFDGRWTVLPTASGCEVRFEAVVDLGIASLAPIVDPVARATLVEVISDILNGLFGHISVHDEPVGVAS